MVSNLEAMVSETVLDAWHQGCLELQVFPPSSRTSAQVKGLDKLLESFMGPDGLDLAKQA